jgi:uncharacterized protein YcnI
MRFRILVTIALSLASAVAVAHVTVWPGESHTGAHEKYVVRVPTEGKVETVSIELQIPEGVNVVSVQAPSGYTYELKKAGDRVIGIVWSMRIAPGEFAEFAFMARNPKDGSQIVWRAIQKFADGSQMEWTGPAGDKHPASITALSGAAEH